MAESMPRKRKANAKEDVGITLDQIEHLLSTGDVDVRMLKESSRKEILRILITAKEFRYIIDPTYGHSYEITQTNLKTGKVTELKYQTTKRIPSRNKSSISIPVEIPLKMILKAPSLRVLDIDVSW
jgi:hypothetical protein